LAGGTGLPIVCWNPPALGSVTTIPPRFSKSDTRFISLASTDIGSNAILCHTDTPVPTGTASKISDILPIPVSMVVNCPVIVKGVVIAICVSCAQLIQGSQVYKSLSLSINLLVSWSPMPQVSAPPCDLTLSLSYL